MKKKIGIIIGIFFSVLVAVVAAIAIYLFVLTETIMLTKIPAPDIQEQLDVYVEAGLCRNAKINDEGTAAIIHLSHYQRNKWVQWISNSMDLSLREANAIDNLQFEVSDDTRTLTMYANQNVNFSTAATYVSILFYDMEIYQVLKGEQDWKIDFIVKDYDTNEILYVSKFPGETIKVTNQLWE